MAIASLVLGIVSLIFMWWPVLSIIAIFTGLIGIVLGAMGQKSLAATGQPTGAATAGIVCSIIGLVFGIIFTIACYACAAGCAMCASPWYW